MKYTDYTTEALSDLHMALCTAVHTFETITCAMGFHLTGDLAKADKLLSKALDEIDDTLIARHGAAQSKKRAKKVSK